MKKPFFARNAFLILVIAIFVMPFMFGGARRALLSNRNDVKEWLPSRFQETVDLRWFQSHFPGEEFVLISWEGCTFDDKRLELLVRKLAPAEETPDRAKDSLFRTALTGPRLIKQLTEPPINLTREEAIDRLRGSLVGPDGKKTCAVLTLTKRGKSDLRASMHEIVRVAEEECKIPEEQLHMGGPPVDNYHIDIEGERTLYRLAALCAVIGLGLAWWCLRSFSLTIMVFFVALYGGAASLAIVYYTGGTVNAVLLTMPSLVYVLCISGAIHIVNYYRDAQHEVPLIRAAGRAVHDAWIPCTLAAGTTAVGLGSLYVSELTPIKTFGLYSAIGVLVSLPLMLAVLPATMQLWPIKERTAGEKKEEDSDSIVARGAESKVWTVFGSFIIRRRTLVMAVCLTLFAFMGYGLSHIETSVKLMNLFSSDARIIRDYAWLERHLGELVPMEVVVRVDKEKCQLTFLERMRLIKEIEANVRSIDVVGSTLSTTTFAPNIPPKAEATPATQRPRRGLFGRVGSKIVGVDRAWLDERVRNKNLLEHRGEFLAGDYLSEDENEEFWRVTARVGALNDIDYGEFVDTIKSKVEPAIAERRGEGIDGLSTTYTGLVPLVYKSQRTLMNNLAQSFGTAFGLIAIVMFFVLRSPVAGLIAMIPNVFPAIVIFGMMGWLGITVDIGSMMCASVALGVGVDDTIHFLTWFRRGMVGGLDRKDAIMAAYQRCGTAMMQTTVVGGLGLAVLALSSFTPTQRFGYLMLTLLTAALVGDLLLLPALLAGPLGRVFKARAMPVDETQPSTATSEAAASAQADTGIAAPFDQTAPRHPHVSA